MKMFRRRTTTLTENDEEEGLHGRDAEERSRGLVHSNSAAWKRFAQSADMESASSLMNWNKDASDELTLRKKDIFARNRTPKASEFGSHSGEPRRRYCFSTVYWVCILIVLLGAVASGTIFGLGYSAARKDQQQRFHRVASDLTHRIASAWHDYTVAAAWLHQATIRYASDEDEGRKRSEFRDVYKYLVRNDVRFQGIGWVPNVSESMRAGMENQSKVFFQREYPNIPYNGFIGHEYSNVTRSYQFQNRSKAPFYMPVHCVEPESDNERMIDYDLWSCPLTNRMVRTAFHLLAPAVSEVLCPDRGDPDLVFSKEGFCSVLLAHPGIRFSHEGVVSPSAPSDLSLIVIPVPYFLLMLGRHYQIGGTLQIRIFDSTNTSKVAHVGSALMSPGPDPVCPTPSSCADNASSWGDDGDGPRNRSTSDVEWSPYEASYATNFTQPNGTLTNSSFQHPFSPHGLGTADTQSNIEMIAAVDFEQARKTRFFYHETVVEVPSRKWTVIMTADHNEFEPDISFVILGTVMIFLACVCLALWMYTNHHRETKLAQVRSSAETEKAAMMVESARRAAKAERELNDYIAHEVRNPLSAAISACSFVASAVSESTPLQDPETRQSVRDDVAIMDASLTFINDLLRNMLDLHRASSNQLIIERGQADVLNDILQPVSSMLYSRGADFEVLVDCPTNIVVMADRLRLKQVILNLGRNAVKFVSKGFVRLGAAVLDGHVRLFVEDSGPGIPPEKRKRLFAKFQESLDSLNQGTGIGLCVCRHLVDLMGGEIWLDDEYQSGLDGYPGTRFVIDLKAPPTQLDMETLNGGSGHERSTASDSDAKNEVEEEVRQLPEHLRVLFTDDDMLLRKLFSRSVKKLQPQWEIFEAANGETSLQMVDSMDFDLIFMDQYMASVDKQLLGTETVRALRAKGVTSRICGLSANDLEGPFLRAGADAFLIKPFPCVQEALTKELLRILYHHAPKEESAIGSNPTGDGSSTATASDDPSTTPPRTITEDSSEST